MLRLLALVVAAILIGCAPTPPPLPPVVAWAVLNPVPASPMPAAAQPAAADPAVAAPAVAGVSQ